MKKIFRKLTVLLFIFTILLIVYDVFLAEKNIPVLMYHRLDYIENPINVYPHIFYEQLEYLSQKGFTAVSIEDIYQYQHKRTALPEKPVIITFDDGYFNNFFYAAPILKKHNMRAIFSVVQQFCRSTSEADTDCSAFAENISSAALLKLSSRHLTQSYPEYASISQIQSMINSGIADISCHTYSHFYPKSSEIPADVLEKEFFSSKKFLAETFKKPIRALTFPRGIYSDTLVKNCRENGYSFFLLQEKGSYSADDTIIPRFGVFNRFDFSFKLYIFMLEKSWRIKTALLLFNWSKKLFSIHNLFYDEKSVTGKNP